MASGAVAATVGTGGAPRLSALDGLRGVAAVVVVITHLFEFTDVSPDVRAGILATPLGVLVNGPAAVHVFFVLSGYVLALSLSRDWSAAGIVRYWPRRVLRIHPPYVAAVLLAWVASIGFPLLGSPALRAAGQAGWCLHVPGELLPRALILPSLAFGQLPIGWSLWVELAMSMVFPLLLWMGRALHPLAPVALGLLLVDQVHPRLFFSIFTLNFALGVALFLERERVAAVAARLSRGGWALWLVAAVALLQAAWPFAWWRDRTPVLPGGHSPGVVLTMSFGAALLLVAALHCGPLHRAFDSALGRWLGRVSYSLYLVHWTVIVFFACRVTSVQMTPATALLVLPLVLGVALALAELGYRCVERPSIAAGRWLTRVGRIRAVPSP